LFNLAAAGFQPALTDAKTREWPERAA